jgi:hypothetical protein
VPSSSARRARSREASGPASTSAPLISENQTRHWSSSYLWAVWASRLQQHSIGDPEGGKVEPRCRRKGPPAGRDSDRVLAARR